MSTSKKPTARDIAFQIALHVKPGAFLQSVLDDFLTKSDLSSQERRQCSDLVYSFFRLRIKVFWILDQFLKNSGKLPKAMLLHLALAVTSLVAQSRAPAYAVVFETVEQIRKQYGKKMAGVANAVLRSILKSRGDINDKDWYIRKAHKEDSLHGLSIYYGIPYCIASLWRKAYGFENMLALMERSSCRPWRGIRLNAAHPAAASLRVWLLERAGENLQAISDWGFALSPFFELSDVMGKPWQKWRESGVMDFQAAGSQMLLEKLGIFKWRGPLYDCCAGVGGKSELLANFGAAPLLCSDLSWKRVKTFDKLWKAPASKPFMLRMDAARPALKKWQGDIMADVPCSGLGVLARRPDLRKIENNFNSKLAEYKDLQRKILRSNTDILQANGRLAYLTCTLNPDENEKNVQWLLRQYPRLELETEWQTPMDHPWLEGMYGAVLIKKR